MKEVLKIENVSKKYQAKNGELEAIKDVSFSVKDGEFISIIGPSRMWKIHSTFHYSRLRRKNIRKCLYRK